MFMAFIILNIIKAYFSYIQCASLIVAYLGKLGLQHETKTFERIVNTSSIQFNQLINFRYT